MEAFSNVHSATNSAMSDSGFTINDSHENIFTGTKSKVAAVRLSKEETGGLHCWRFPSLLRSSVLQCSLVLLYELQASVLDQHVNFSSSNWNSLANLSLSLCFFLPRRHRFSVREWNLPHFCSGSLKANQGKGAWDPTEAVVWLELKELTER